ncbi:MAG: glycoside hydrolase family 43 protein [Arcanobacterium sp.]|nr:glycoside hydrolase family 43 protein [Arcanobacterium sp.]MDY5589084.1 glycoside hydrolase family 43 protein [Arcanobacterium sp.]
MARRIKQAGAVIAVMLIAACALGNDKGEKPRDVLHDGSRISPQLLAAGADPWIMKRGNFYYSVESLGDSVALRRSAALSSIAAAERQIIHLKTGDTAHKVGDFWAPELHYLDGSWHIYVAGKRSGDDIHRMYVLSNPADNPSLGHWKFEELGGMDDKFAIDGTVVENNTGRYFVWSGWEGYTNVQQNLYIAHMVSPTQVKSEKILISRPEFSWETVGSPKVNEGPTAITVGKTVNLAYSASGSWTDSYCIGVLTAPVDADLAAPGSWAKQSEPVLASGNGVVAPGHNSFVSTQDGNVYMIYHAARYSGSGWDRAVRYQKVSFDSAGVLQAAEPVSGAALAPIPMGDPPRVRMVASDVVQKSKKLVITKDSKALGGQALAGFEHFDDTAVWNIDIPHHGTYAIFVWARPTDLVKEAKASQDLALIRVTVNGEQTDRDIELPQSQDYQPAVLTLQLRAGQQRIGVSADAPLSPLLISAIELTPSRS